LDRAMSVELLIEDIAATIRRPKVNKTLQSYKFRTRKAEPQNYH